MQRIQILGTETKVDGKAVHSIVVVIWLVWTGKSLECARADVGSVELMHGRAVFSGYDNEIDLNNRLLPSV